MTTEIGQIYKCDKCGNIVCIAHAGEGELVCCDAPMVLMTENTVDASKEKHVPVIEKISGGYKVKVGTEPHPMEEKHHIEWIELMADGMVMIKPLKAGEAPEAVFKTEAKSATAREYCNVHGLWAAKG